MAKEPTPEGKVRRWVEGVLAQAADEDIAATTLAVLWNGGSVGDGTAVRPHRRPARPLATLLHEPFAELGSADPELDASLAAHAVVGTLVRPPLAADAAVAGRDRPRRRLLPGDGHGDGDGRPRPMTFHLFLPQMRMPLDAIVERARAAEAAGFEGMALHGPPRPAAGRPSTTCGRR